MYRSVCSFANFARLSREARRFRSTVADIDSLTSVFATKRRPISIPRDFTVRTIPRKNTHKFDRRETYTRYVDRAFFRQTTIPSSQNRNENWRLARETGKLEFRRESAWKREERTRSEVCRRSVDNVVVRVHVLRTTIPPERHYTRSATSTLLNLDRFAFFLAITRPLSSVCLPCGHGQ